MDVKKIIFYLTPTLDFFTTHVVLLFPFVFLRILNFDNGRFKMETEKKQNKNALRSKRLIRQAFVSLIKTKPANKITITDIVTEANINRATFYAHYSCLKDLIDEIEQDVIDKLMNVLNGFKLENFFSNPTPLLLQVSIFLSEDPDYYKTLASTPESSLFIEKLKLIFVNYMEQDASIPLEVRKSKTFHICAMFFAGGLTSLYTRWLNGQLDCTLYDIALEVSKLFSMVNWPLKASVFECK